MQGYNNLNLTGIFEPIVLEELEITQKYNDHAKIYARGLIPAGLEDDLILQTLERQEIGVEIKDAEAAEPLFCGVLERAEVTHRGDVYHMSLEGISKSALPAIFHKSVLLVLADCLFYLF